MGAPVSGIQNVKIFILYLLENINYPLDHATINDIVRQTDYVMYLDFVEAFDELKKSELLKEEIKNGALCYSVTEKGRIVARELKSNIYSVILDQSLEAAFRYLDFKQRGVVADCDVRERPDRKFDLTCTLVENGIKIFETSIIIDSLDRAERIRKRYMERPDVVYRGVVSLLTGKMEFLFS